MNIIDTIILNIIMATREVCIRLKEYQNGNLILIVNGEEYTGISILEILDKIIQNPEQYCPADQRPDMQDLRLMFKRFAQYNLNPNNNIPTLGFRLDDDRSVLPTKRIVDVGFDLTIIDVAKVVSEKTIMFESGVALNIPLGYYVELIPRSSLSKTGYMLANSVGVIDPCYTGTIKVPLIKIDDSMPDLILPAKVAQLILKPYVFAYGRQIDYIKPTTRGAGGFGSTDGESLIHNNIMN